MLFTKQLPNKKPTASRGETLTQIAGDRLRRRQRIWSVRLQGQFQKLPFSRQWMVLLLFCVLGLGLSAWQLSHAFSGEKKKALLPQIRLPTSFIATARARLPKGNMSKAEWQRVQSFRRYTDSLQQSASGKAVLDSLLVTCPGILDSLTQVENIYQSQFKP